LAKSSGKDSTIQEKIATNSGRETYMSSLLERMMKTGSSKESAILSKSKFFNAKEFVPTELPILNIAFSGSLDGGLVPGLTVLAGKSKTFKTMTALYCMKAYLEKYPEGIALLYDSEFGITPDYIASFDIDTDRVIHIPIKDVEELKFDITQKLQEIGDKERVFIMIDSVGNLASKKEVEDAQNEKSVADMTRAKSLKSLFRIITPYLTTKNIPCIAINHVYDEIGLYPKAIVGGGTGVMYSSNQVFIISKSQEKEGTDISGWKFTINIEKSRYVKEKSKLPFTVLYDSGIQKWSSLFELAMEAGYLIKPKVGWYQTVDPETGEISEKNYRQAEIQKNNEWFEMLIKNTDFKEFVEKKYKLSSHEMTATSPKKEEDDLDIEE
jgi:RecA/RadA recombinase